MHSKKLVFYFPRFEIVNDRVVGIAYYDLRDNFIEKVKNHHPDLMLSEMKRRIHSNHEYDIEVITVYTTDEHETDICRAFIDAICKLPSSSNGENDYHYEVDDILVIVKIGKPESNSSNQNQALQ